MLAAVYTRVYTGWQPAKGITVQLTYDEAELLASHDYEAPLIAGGVRCHGGFDADGTYVSPRTKHRAPAIEAWQTNHRATFGTELMGVPLDTWPGHYPNVAQARFLIESGLPEPIINTLTRIGTVEGFGGMIRLAPVPDRRRTFVEDTDGTALAHLTTGLFEAHARDEAGWEPTDGEAEGGHKQMWFAARDQRRLVVVRREELGFVVGQLHGGSPSVGGEKSVNSCVYSRKHAPCCPARSAKPSSGAPPRPRSPGRGSPARPWTTSPPRPGSAGSSCTGTSTRRATSTGRC